MFSKEIFYDRLKSLRTSKKLTQTDVADALSVKKQYVSRWETGITEPDLKTLTALADYFGVSIDYLVGRTDDPHLYLGEAQLGGHGIMTAKAKVEKEES